jgi:hypothetical protein
MGLSDDSSISQNILGYAHRQKGIGTLGGVWKRLGVSELYSENILALSFARAFSFYLTEGEADRRKNLSLGITLSFMNWDSGPTVGANGKMIEDLPGWRGFGFDMGLVIWPSENVPVAVALQNVNEPDVASESSEIAEGLPMVARMGVAVVGEEITWAMDMILRDGEIDLRVGLERWYGRGATGRGRQGARGNFMLRAGFRLENLAWGTNVTLGAGYKPSDSVCIDYAFVYPVNTILNTFGSHRISIVYDF